MMTWIEEHKEVKNLWDKIEGRLFQHYKGNIYRVEGLSLNAESEPPVINVLYRKSMKNMEDLTGPLWSKSLSEFLELIYVDGEMIQKYKVL